MEQNNFNISASISSVDISNVKIEKMKLYHLEQIKTSLTEDFDDFWDYETLKNELNNPNSEYFIAICDIQNNANLILGFAGIWHSIDDTHITNIVTRKNFRKNGVGTLLLNKLIEVSKKENFKSITLEVNENNINAINLYQKHGFEKLGIRKKYYNNKDSAIIMTKTLQSN